ncbi:MAG: hypothetical protein K0R64_2486 [Novosphingobium lindaniclasticum]|jgi:hypothetical protein|uniref:RNA polymerase subunit sigma-32 n=1 Tax=Novosphingobium lindaniclasticum LE124 TaxID=1096930 RepID=T0IDE5_9SPHN|nr:DUF2322 family protein [Novosphingobium lindaniclasticum]EQB07649.1 hypothetical protein L284_22585 [Novosphingobium lindaniclasticum LE124]MDF2639502.1 hypothetical protein [Novosphingobium lindaniclasticum]
MPAPILPSATFKDNLAQLPSNEGVDRIELVDREGAIVAAIENQPGKQGSLAVYHYLKEQFGALNGDAARAGLALFAEHVEDARNRPGAHPNIDRLFEIAAGADELAVVIIAAKV